MNTVTELKPLNNEMPSEFAERLGQLYAKTVTSLHKKQYVIQYQLLLTL